VRLLLCCRLSDDGAIDQWQCQQCAVPDPSRRLPVLEPIFFKHLSLIVVDNVPYRRSRNSELFGDLSA